ncbi:MarR family transcriptional regulator [Rubrobacter xylanophilus]|nr:MarR family transcriptional regulator [Rubrobacter xylanophilus]
MSDQTERRTGLIAELDRRAREFNAQAVMFSQAMAGRLGINATDLQCLNLLSQRGSMTVGQLAEVTGLTPGAITGVVDRLEGAGYARRERDREDRRRVIVSLSGGREISPMFDAVRRASEELYSAYTDEELVLILDFFTRAVPVLREQTARLREGGV